jgi:predicted metal-binding membrane protein
VATRVAPRAAAPAAGARVVAALLAVALVTWIVTIERMGGMDAGPGTDLGTLGWFLGVWVTMMAAMMFPAVAPMVVVVARVSGGRSSDASGTGWITPAFVAGYLAVWTAYGLAAYGVFRALEAASPGFLAWDRQGPLVAGAAVAAAGAYQLTPLKRACLRHCRSPLSFVMLRWRSGRTGALAMGLEHGAWCLGCCAGLMLVLLVLGAMSITWMAVAATVIFAEKVLPIGVGVSRLAALALVGLGVWIAAAPGSVPGLTEPGMAMPMMERPASTDDGAPAMPMDAPSPMPMDAPSPMPMDAPSPMPMEHQ